MSGFDFRVEEEIDAQDSKSGSFSLAASTTQKHFAKRRRIFNPVYVSNVCLANCSYCSFKRSNVIPRRTLSVEETVSEVAYLQGRGVDNVLLLAGDYSHDKYVRMLEERVEAVVQNCSPEWLGLEVATLSVEHYERLARAGADSVTVFQETYNYARYNELHRESDYKSSHRERYEAPFRALSGGFGEVGLGVLLGLAPWEADVELLQGHAEEILMAYPAAKLRFSFPRLQRSLNQRDTSAEHKVDDETLKSIVGSFRLRFPQSSIVMTGRERPEFLLELAQVADVIGYGGSTEVGGYAVIRSGPEQTPQFELDRGKSFTHFVSDMTAAGYRLR